MNSVRSNAAASHMRATNSCFMTGMLARATGPTARMSTGTLRQPTTFWLW